MRVRVVVLQDIVVRSGALEDVHRVWVARRVFADHLEQVLVLHAHVAEELAVSLIVLEHVAVGAKQTDSEKKKLKIRIRETSTNLQRKRK